jgi:peptide/nickel transport system ATP-binding protein
MQLEAKNISFRYDKGSIWILKDVNLSVEAGERVALVGPSGYGKSTLSKILSGYALPTEGEVLWDGKVLPTRGYCPVQMVYQHPELAVNPRHKMSKILNESFTPDEESLKRWGLNAVGFLDGPVNFQVENFSAFASLVCWVQGQKPSFAMR